MRDSREDDKDYIVSLCVMCKDEDVSRCIDDAVAFSKESKMFMGQSYERSEYFSIGLNKLGIGKATHWFCCHERVTKVVVEELLDGISPSRFNSPITAEVMYCEDFLKKHDLQIINKEEKNREAEKQAYAKICCIKRHHNINKKKGGK